MSFNDRGSHCTPLFSLAFIELLIYDTQQRFYCCVRVSDIEAEKTLMPYLIQRITSLTCRLGKRSMKPISLFMHVNSLGLRTLISQSS